MRRIYAAAVFLLITALAARADQVTLKNGDRLTGTITKSDGTNVVIKSDLAGEVTIPLTAVTAITTNAPMHIALKDRKTVVGTFVTNDGKIEVATKDSGAIAAPSDTIVAVRDDAAQREYERELHPRLIDMWSGLLDTGLSLTSGNSSTKAFTFSGKAARVTSKNKLSLYGTAVYASDNTTPPERTTAQAIHAGLRDDITLSDKLFVFGFTDFDYDEFLHLDLRNVIGGGLGYHVINTKVTQFDVFGGASLNQEWFGAYTTANPAPPPDNILVDGFNRRTGEIVVGESLATKIGSRTTLSEQFSFYPNVSNMGDYRTTFDATAATKLKNWLSWQVTFSDRYLSNPPTGLKGNDLLLSTGVRLTFGRGVF